MAQAVLDQATVQALLVVEFLEPVPEWRTACILPMGTALTDQPRCTLAQGEFVVLAASKAGLAPGQHGSTFDAVLVDIDHTSELLLDSRSDSFNQPEGLARLRRQLKPGGIFGLRPKDQTDARFRDRIAQAFPQAWAEPVSFHNPLTDRPFTQTVYPARNGANAPL